MSEQLKKRGANYTREEKSLLADLLTQHAQIIDDKRTSGLINKKKQEAWRIITAKYNNHCSTGPRRIGQLRILYDNIKRRSRRSNGKPYRLVNIKTQYQKNRTVTEVDATETLENLEIKNDEPKSEVDEKLNETCRPIQAHSHTVHNNVESFGFESSAKQKLPSWRFSEELQKVGSTEIANVGGDAPLCSPHESGATFYDKDINPMNGFPTQELPSYGLTHTIKVEEASQESIPEVRNESPPRVLAPVRKITVNKRRELIQKNSKKPLSSEDLKRLYFKKKCLNANLERKKMMVEILHMKREHSMKMLILKKKLENIPQ